METIFVNKTGRLAKVDDEDRFRVNRYNWSISNGRSICARVDGKTMNLARFILNNPNCDCVDHIDGDVYNNQKSNLRQATYNQNSYNKRVSSLSITQIKGVQWDPTRKKYKVLIRVNGVRKFIGRFDTIEEAEIAYGKVILEHHGEFAHA